MKLFSPLIQILNKLTYIKKFLIVGIVLLVPLITMSVLYLTTVLNDREQTKRHMEAATYNAALKDVLQYSQQLRALNISLLTDPSVQTQVDDVTKKVNAAFADVNELVPTLEDDFDTLEQLAKLEQQWHNIEQSIWTNSHNVYENYSNYAENILALMQHITYESGLILATSSEEFTLIHNTSIKLPQLAEQFGKLRALGVTMIEKGEQNTAEHAEIEMISAQVQQALIDLEKDAAVIFKNSLFEAALSTKIVALEQTTTGYLEAIRKAEQGIISTSDYYGIATNAINENFDYYTASMETLVMTLQEDYKSLVNTQIFIFVVTTVTIFIALILFVGLFLAIRQSITLLKDGATKVAEGDITATVALHTQDEMYEVEIAFNQMTKQLQQLVEEIQTSAEHVSSASEELHASAEEATSSVEHVTHAVNDLATESDTQLQHLTDSTHAMEDMVTSIERIAKNSVDVATLANNATLSATAGHETVQQALQEMMNIQHHVAQTNDKMNELHEQSTQIDSIVHVITDIADQTNLLALNAAIEAARAGEHGAGFAVVADEVRKLASESRQSASQITQLISGMQRHSVESVAMMRTVTANVDTGMQMTQQTAQQFGEISSTMQVLSPQMAEISSTATAFSTQVEQVSAAIQHLLALSQHSGDVTSEIAASTEEQLAVMEEVSSSAQALSHMAESLQAMVTRFKL